MIVETIELLRSTDHYGAGELVEFAKGKDQMISTLRDARRKIKRKKMHKKWSRKY